MAYNQRYEYDPIYRGMSPAAQVASVVTGGLGTVLGGYLSAKLEEDRMRREFEGNKRVLQASYPNMPDEQLDQMSRVPAGQLKDVLGGLQSREFVDVMSAGRGGGMMPQEQAPMQPAEQQLAPEDAQMMQQETPGLEGSSQLEALPDLENTPKGSFSERQVIRAANEEAAEIGQIEQALMSSNLDEKRYMQVSQELSKRKDNLVKNLINQEKISLKQAEIARNQENEDRKFAFEREKYLSTLSERDAKREDLRIKRLDDKHGEYYNNLMDKEMFLEQDLETLKIMSKLNSDPNSEFGYQGFNVIAKGWLAKKLGDASGYMPVDAQTFEKLTANIITRKIMQMKGVGRVTNKMVEQIEKQVPNLMQSPAGRQRIIDMLIAQSKLENAEIKEAKRIKKANKYQFTDDFREKISKKMKPFYRKYRNKVLGVTASAEKKSAAQEQKFQERGFVSYAVPRGLSGVGRQIESLVGAPSVIEKGKRSYSGFRSGLGEMLNRPLSDWEKEWARSMSR